jgi:hypothetical protein
MFAREVFREPLQPTMLEDADRPRLFPDDGSDIVDRESPDDSEQDDFGLIGRQACNTSEGCLGFALSEEASLWVSGIGGLERALERIEYCTPTPVPTPEVDETPAGDRKEPPSKGRLITLEARKARSGIQPYLGGEVLSICGRLRAQVAEETRLKIAVEEANRPLGSLLRRRENLLESISHRERRLLALEGDSCRQDECWGPTCLSRRRVPRLPLP